MQSVRSEEAHRPAGKLLHRKAKNPLAVQQVLRLHGCDVVEKRLERSQTLVAGCSSTVPYPFKPGKIPGQHFWGDVADPDPVGLDFPVGLTEDEEQLESVAVGRDGVRTQVPL